MAFEKSDLQNLTWQEVLDLQKPYSFILGKGHDKINTLMNESPLDNEFVMNMAMGRFGGGANIGKFAKNVLTKILSRKAKGIRNIKNMAGKGEGSISSGNRAYLANEAEKYRSMVPRTAQPAAKDKSSLALLPLLLASMVQSFPMLSPFEGEIPNIGRPPKQY